MKILGWDVLVDAWQNVGRWGSAGIYAYRNAEGKTLAFSVQVPWLAYINLTLFRERRPPVPTMFVDVNGFIEVPATLGDKAPGAVLDALIEMAEARRWGCGVGVKVSEEDDDE